MNQNILGLIVPVRTSTEESDNAAEFCPDTKTITVFTEKDLREHIHDIIHENGHALCYRLGLTNHIDSKFEEILVESFANMMTENFEIKFKSPQIQQVTN